MAGLSIATAAQAAVFQLDFDNSMTNPTQSGWEAFTDTSDPNNKSVNYSGYPDLATGDITIATSGVLYTRAYDNSSTVDDFPGTTLDALYSDLILRNNTSGTLDISIAGLTTGDYRITTHHLISANNLADVSAFDLLVQDADSAAFSQVVGNYEMGRGVDGSYFAPTIVTFDVTSNGTDPIVVRLAPTSLGPGGTLNWVGINGLEIAVIPEPSSLALLGIIGLIFRRRRNR